MHKYKISNAKTIVLLALICCTGSISIAQIINPIAHYPLEAELLNRKFSANKLKVYRPGYWDVSGNGNHGQLVVNNNTLFDNETVLNYFDVDSMFYGKPCMKKIAVVPDERPVNFQIPDPYNKLVLDRQHPGIQVTISFWIKLGSFNDCDVLSLPKLKVSLKGRRPVLTCKYNNAIKDFQGNLINTSDKWYFMAFTIYIQSSVIDVKSFIYESESNTPLVSLASDIIGNTGLENISTDHYIFGTTFIGSLSNVRFYQSLLDESNFGTIKAADMKWNSPDWGKKFSDNIKEKENYVLKGASLYYPLGGNANELVEHKNGTINGVTYTAIKGRFGANSNSLALSMSDNTYIDLPDKLFDTEQKTEAGEKLFRGVTLSYWIKVPVFPVNEAKGAERPFTPQQLSTPTRLLHARDAQNRVLYGMDVVNDRLGNMRYSWDGSNNLYNWFAWYYDPVSFSGNATDQWYHVIQVADTTYMKTYMYKLGVDEFCTQAFDPLVPHDHCTCSYSFLGIQSLADATKWGLGNFAGKNYPMSDFRVYNWPMTKFEVMTLHTLESINETPASQSFAKGIISAEEEQKTGTDNQTMLYPNPAENEVTVSLFSKAGGKVNISLKDFTGRKLFSSAYNLAAGSQRVTINLSKYSISKGVYLVEISGAGLQKTVKLVKQ